jgi:Divergent InlB B-repeat domain
MKGSYIGLAMGALVTVAALLSFPSCGHDRKLVSIEIHPASFTFLTPDTRSTGQFSAIGTYIHPPATRDITSQATWKVADNVVTMNAGLVSPTGGCGSADVSASLPEGTGGASNIVIGYGTVTVNDPSDPNCPGGGTEATLGVQVSPTGFGTVTSLTGGISCPTQCVSAFPVGASVGLTATPTAGHSFVSWTGCTSSSGNTCTVTIPVGGASVSATFQ